MAFPSWPDLGADQLERQLLERWQAEGLFQRTLEAGKGGKPFVFYEGPPRRMGGRAFTTSSRAPSRI